MYLKLPANLQKVLKNRMFRTIIKEQIDSVAEAEIRKPTS